ncbi:YybH family protein [Hufsiella ginkgonis]|uniref:DUF4440 domain-containing protein n=1 Tax=Hufsiella ginkgonis TaxID=2695274 RepID=A0A7K1Y0Z1_9SPHI|nr:hypothetical protein [Hufsiella ginkgonis]MXV16934.1 hypothetical protein [Hufsiella ginkgonis]
MQLNRSTGLFFLLVIGSSSLRAQTNTDLVGKLVSAENYFAAITREKGIAKAFLAVSDENTLVFRPGPLKAAEFFKDQPENGAQLAWEPVYARVARSGDWGFTTGPYTFKKSDTSSVISYGDYFSVWKKRKNGPWKLALDIGAPHPRPVAERKLVFLNPDEQRFIHQQGKARLQQRADIVQSSDQLYATVLKADNAAARKEFLAENTRLLFPGEQPISGRTQVNAFWEKKQVKVQSEYAGGDRALSGELAYTYGSMTIVSKGKVSTYTYVRLWEITPTFKWNVVMEVYAPASN